MPDTHVYVVVRADLPPAHQAVQATHAGIAAARELIPDDLDHPSLVLLTVPNQSALIEASEKCSAAGIDFRIFHEADMNDEPTAFATAPINGAGRKLFKNYPLLKFKESA